jgi:two-component system, LytTR family, sensor kinase
MRRSGADGVPINSANPIVLASGREISRATVFDALHYGGWITFGAIWFSRGIASLGVLPSAINHLSWITVGSAVTLVFRQIYRRTRAAHFSYPAIGILALILSAVGAPLWFLVDQALNLACLTGLMHVKSLAPIFITDASEISADPMLIPGASWIIYTSVLFTWSSLYHGINAMLDLEIERAHVVHAMKLADDARLKALQSQLNPHFLFNALNGIATLIRDKDVVAAASMVDALSDFLRSMLQKVELPEIAVAEELNFIDQYLRIQRFRFGDRLRTSVDADQECLHALIPTLILQPLVENAVRHGVLPREEGGSLYVSVRKQGDALVVSVEDDGPGKKTGPSQPYGVGLGNSTDRLAALYGDAASLTIGCGKGGAGFAVVIRMPFRKTLEGRPLAKLVAVTA